MDRQQMLDALGALGFDASKVTDAVPDETLAEFLSLLQKMAESGQEPEQMAELSRDDMAAALVEKGHPKDELDALGDEEIKSLFEKEVQPAGQFREGERELFREGERGLLGGYAEGGSREKMVAALVAKGQSQEELDGKSDDEIKALYAVEFQPEQPAQMAEGDLGRDDMIAALKEMGHAEEELSALSDEELKALYDAELQQPPEEPVVPPVPGPQGKPQVMSERKRPMQQTDDSAALRAALRELIQEEICGFRDELLGAKRDTEHFIGNVRKANIRTFCENLRDAGQVLPVELERTVARLNRASTAKLHVFSEKGHRVRKSELDLQMEELQARPPLVPLVERLGQPTTRVDGEIAKIKNHYARFAEKYHKAGIKNVSALIKAFKIERRRNPQVAANDFLHTN